MKWSLKKKEPPQPQSVPLYQLILENLDENNRLPDDFSFPQAGSPNEIRFAAGAMDGIGVYHMAAQDTAQQASQLAALLEQACEQFNDQIKSEIELFLKENRVLHMIDPLIEYIRNGHTKITPASLKQAAFELMTGSDDVESVKLGIAMTGILNIEDEPDCRKGILTLGKSDEFTLYSLVAVSGWKDGNDIIFQYAREMRGWGKIHAVERLEPSTEEIRDWLICSGCKNDIVDSYLGLTCADKGRLSEYLQRKVLPDEYLEGAGIILSAMLDEGPSPGMSAYEEGPDVIRNYLCHVHQLSSLKALRVVLELRAWIRDSEWPEKEELLLLCNQITSRPEWPGIIIKSIVPGNNTELWRAVYAAQCMELDIASSLFQVIKSDPMEYYNYISGLCRNPDYAQDVFRLYEQCLPLQDIAAGMGELMGMGAEFRAHSCLDFLLQELSHYPGEGITLIRTGLHSPVVRNRNTALKALAAWSSLDYSLAEHTPDILELLDQLRTDEVNDTTKENIETLLNQYK